MAPDRYDIVVFGATGYTGKHVVQELTRIAPVYCPGLSWAVAGRSKGRLETLLRNVTEKTDVELSSTHVIAACVEDEASLRAMCSQAKLLLNCCGPFVKLGEPVVRVAIECGTHYVDVNGEQLFVDILARKYDQQAREAGVYIVTTCGLSSVPADLGVIHLQDNFGGTLNSVEAYLIIDFPQKFLAEKSKGTVRYSSWESMINSMAEMPLVNNQIKPSSPQSEPVLKKRCILHKNLNKWCLPFPGTDAEVVNRTQRHLMSTDHKRPVQYQAYITFSSLLTAITVVFAGALIFLLSKISFMRKLLLNHPRICSFGIVTHDHPEDGVMDDMRFQYDMIGEGWDREVGTDEKSPTNRKVIGRVSVSGADPAYVGTAVAVIFSAFAVLQEQDKMPKGGGVMTPGVAFRNTSLIRNLHKNNVNFEIIENK